MTMKKCVRNVSPCFLSKKSTQIIPKCVFKFYMAFINIAVLKNIVNLKESYRKYLETVQVKVYNVIL